MVRNKDARESVFGPRVNTEHRDSQWEICNTCFYGFGKVAVGACKSCGFLGKENGLRMRVENKASSTEAMLGL